MNTELKAPKAPFKGHFFMCLCVQAQEKILKPTLKEGFGYLQLCIDGISETNSSLWRGGMADELSC